MTIDRKTISQLTCIEPTPGIQRHGEIIIEQGGNTFKAAVSTFSTSLTAVTGVQGSGNNICINDSSFAGAMFGDGNTICYNAGCAFIGAGKTNTTEQSASFIGAGVGNSIFAPTGAGCKIQVSSIVAGSANNIFTTNGHILGGSCNTIKRPASDSFILGTSISAFSPNYTYVDNLTSKGVIDAVNILSGGDNIVNVVGKQTLQGVTDAGKCTTNQIQIFPPNGGRALTSRSTSDDNEAVSVSIEGPVTLGHDLFKRSGFTGGFGDGSNHFHELTDINLIEQQSESDVKNLERIQRRYYAITANKVRHNAAFLADHRVARAIDTSIIDTSTATLNVQALQDSNNRGADTQNFFANNTTPDGKSEEIVISLAAHGLPVGQQVRIEFTQSFSGPIVAAALFGKITANTTNTFNVELYGGNYKTTVEVPKSTDAGGTGSPQTALTFDEVILETIGSSTIVNSGNEQYLALYNKTFTGRLSSETLSAKWSSSHGLTQNEHVTFITDGRGDLKILEDAFVLDPAPDGDLTSAIFVYGRRQKQYNLASFTPFTTSNWTVHKGSIDGIHNDVLADTFINFNADRVGKITSFQIGPGAQTDNAAIAIGNNVYNKDENTVKIGYGAGILDITTKGISVSATDGNESGCINGALIHGIQNKVTCDPATTYGGGSSILGGLNNLIRGRYNVVGGGNTNKICAGEGNTIGGGSSVVINSGNYSTVAGGRGGFVAGSFNTVAGGRNGCVYSGTGNFIAGGYNNHIKNSAADSGIIGGQSNTVCHNCSFIIGMNSKTTADANTLYTCCINNSEIFTNDVTATGALSGCKLTSTNAAGIQFNPSAGTNQLTDLIPLTRAGVEIKSSCASANSKCLALFQVDSSNNPFVTIGTAEQACNENALTVHGSISARDKIRGQEIYEGGVRVCTTLTDTLQDVTGRGNLTTAGLSGSLLSAGHTTLHDTLSVRNTLFVKNDGKVGIGPNLTPAGSLHIKETDGTKTILLEGSSTTSSDIIFNNGSSDSGMVQYDYNAGALNLCNGGSAPRFQIESDGKIGVATITPNELFTVSGNVSALGTINAFGNISENGARVCTTKPTLTDVLNTCNESTASLSAFTLSAGNQIVVGTDFGNKAPGANSSVTGGINNCSSGACSHVGGGCLNIARQDASIVVGGSNNTVTQNHSIIVGGSTNRVFGTCSLVVGGEKNIVSTCGSLIVGGCCNQSAGTGNFASILGGRYNCLGNGAFHSVILGTSLSACGSDSICTTFTNNLSSQGFVSSGSVSALDGVDFNGSIIGCNFTIVKGVITSIS